MRLGEKVTVFLVVGLFAHAASAQTSGSFSAQFWGGAGQPFTHTVHWVKNGNVVTLYTVNAITFTGAAGQAMNFCKLPSALKPTNDKWSPTIVINDGKEIHARAKVRGGSDGCLDFEIGRRDIFLDTINYSAGFSGGTPKGLPAGWQFSYVDD